jgi:hypothetical protein
VQERHALVIGAAETRLDPRPTLGDVDEPDPHYLELLRSSKLPQAYLPAAMAGPQKPWVRAAASVIIGILLLATALGVCLTYGPGA